MRKARLKPQDRPVYYHLYNRVAGGPGFRPFGPREKEKFVELLHKLSKFYTVRVLAYQVMSNHYHLMAYAPQEVPSPEEVCRRYRAYYGKRKKLKPTDERCEQIGRRMRDISCFMHALQQQFSSWFNRTRPERRWGSLWAGRFKNTLLGDATAVWECWKYIEMNPVRAGLVREAGAYRHSSYGAWQGRGRHPFEEHVKEILVPWLSGRYGFSGLRTVRRALGAALREAAGVGETPGEGGFRLCLDRRMRYWVDGLVIGSSTFIEEMRTMHRRSLPSEPREPVQAKNERDEPVGLYCCKKLRAE